MDKRFSLREYFYEYCFSIGFAVETRPITESFYLYKATLPALLDAPSLSEWGFFG